ncbi:MAG: hypothetical protein ACXW4Q_05165 [Anaerolineales bacterium]
MNALIQPRLMKVLVLVLLVLAITVSLVNAWGNYQQEEFEKMLKGKAPTRKGCKGVRRTEGVQDTAKPFGRGGVGNSYRVPHDCVKLKFKFRLTKQFKSLLFNETSAKPA